MMRRNKATTSRLRHKLWLQEEVRTSDGTGGFTRSWNNVAEVWAEITPLGGRENAFAGGVQAVVTHRLTLRYRNSVSAGMRFLFEGRAFNIRTVLNLEERGETLEIMAEEGAAD